MADLQYNFLSDNFTTFENVEAPKKVLLEMPLLDTPLDISDRFVGVSENGTPIAANNIESKVVFNNNKEVQVLPVDYTSVQQKPQSSINPNLTDKKKQAMNFFVSKGLSAHAAAGIVGNLMQESGLNTTIKGDGGKAFGLAQWHPDRQKGLKALAKSRGSDISDFETQLEYVWQELNSSHKSALNGLLNSTNVEQATTAFMKHFEKPGKPHLERRIGYARSLVS